MSSRRCTSTFGALSADVAAVLVDWRPSGVSAADWTVLVPALGDVRRWVAAAAPANPDMARPMMRSVAAIAIWASTTMGTTDVRLVLHPANVEHGWGRRSTLSRIRGQLASESAFSTSTGVRPVRGLGMRLWRAAQGSDSVGGPFPTGAVRVRGRLGMWL